MKFRNTCRLFLAVCVLGIVVWTVNRHVDSTDKRKYMEGFVLDARSETIALLIVIRGDLRVDCLRKNGIWMIGHPVATRADNGAITRILSELEVLPNEEVITASQRKQRELGLDDYGFDKPRARLMIGDWYGRRKELIIGCDAPLGNLLYVKLADSDDVIATSRAILDTIPEKFDDLRDRIIVHGDPQRTSRIEIQSKAGGFIQLMQSGGRWMIQQPEVARADNDKILEMLHSLYALTAKQFVCDPVPEGRKNQKPPGAATDTKAQPVAKVEPYGLSDETSLRVTVWMQGDEIGRGVILGKANGETSGDIYAKGKDSDSIYAVGKDILDIFSVSANDLKDRNLYSMEPENIREACFQKEDKRVVLKRTADRGWMIVEPGQWKADDQIIDELVRRITHLRIESFVESTQTNQVELGLASPAYTVSLTSGKAETSETNANRLTVGTLLPEKSSIFVKFENDRFIYGISSASMKGLETYPADPLVCRDRSMIAVSPDKVRRLSLSRNGVEQTVSRDQSGLWTAVTPATNRVNEQAVDNILFALSNLRALRIECNDPKNVVAYGLDHPATTLTIGLNSEEGVQKTILIGFLAGTDGMYAMVQGQDVVCVLQKTLVDRLTSDLTALPTTADVKKEEPGKPMPK
jgi:hypothetical protein